MTALFILTLLLQAPVQSGETSLAVRHEHALGSCPGTLIFSDAGVRYETKEKGRQRSWAYPDVKFFEIVSSKKIEIHSYEDQSVLRLGQDWDFVFEFTEGEIGNNLYQLLVDKSPRAVVTHVLFPGTELVQEMPVRHRHNIGGCQGVLTIAEDKIIYRTEHKGDSRIWRLKDIESFASNDPFHLRISTAFETFNFDLKLPLEEKAHEHIWNAVYSPAIQSYSRRRRP